MHRRGLSPNVAALGYANMLTAMSSAMIYGLLPVYMVRVLDVSIASVGVIEGMAEAVNSLIRIVSGTSGSDAANLLSFLVMCCQRPTARPIWLSEFWLP